MNYIWAILSSKQFLEIIGPFMYSIRELNCLMVTFKKLRCLSRNSEQQWPCFYPLLQWKGVNRLIGRKSTSRSVQISAQTAQVCPKHCPHSLCTHVSYALPSSHWPCQHGQGVYNDRLTRTCVCQESQHCPASKPAVRAQLEQIFAHTGAFAADF